MLITNNFSLKSSIVLDNFLNVTCRPLDFEIFLKQLMNVPTSTDVIGTHLKLMIFEDDNSLFLLEGCLNHK